MPKSQAQIAREREWRNRFPSDRQASLAIKEIRQEKTRALRELDKLILWAAEYDKRHPLLRRPYVKE